MTKEHQTIKEILQNSIVEAKAIRATALANAKSFLEEQFNPKFSAMFAEQIADEAASEDNAIVGADVPVAQTNEIASPVDKIGSVPVTTVAPGNPQTNTDTVPGFETVKAGTSLNEEDPANDAIGLSSEELDKIIQELEADVNGEPSTDASATGQMPDVSVDVNANPAVDAANPASAPVAPAPVAPAPAASGAVAPAQDPAAVTPPVEGDEDIDIHELMRQLNETDSTLNEAAKEDGFPTPEGGNDPKMTNVKAKSDNSDGSIEDTKKLTEGKEEDCDEDTDEKDEKGKDLPDFLKENKSLKKRLADAESLLKEATGTTQTLRKQLQEINLFNTKLQHSLKLFRNYPLNEGQKKRVINAFDLTKSVREVMMTYALLAESFKNFGATKVAAPTNNGSTKKTVELPSTVSTITEGLASKTMGSTKPATNIIEEGAMSATALRLKELAGIRPAKKNDGKKAEKK